MLSTTGLGAYLEPDIPEAIDTDNNDDPTPNHHTSLFDHTAERFQETADEVAALKVALSECWTLCNTLAGLSYIHRERIFSDERSHFSFSAKGDMQEQAWKSCWKLCQKLYETRDEEIATQVRPTLDLCRDFCQCLFEVRRRDNDELSVTGRRPDLGPGQFAPCRFQSHAFDHRGEDELRAEVDFDQMLDRAGIDRFGTMIHLGDGRNALSRS